MCGVFLISFPNDNKKQNTNNISEPNNNVIEEDLIDYDSAYETAISLYGGEGKVIEVKEEQSKFIIYVKDNNGNIQNTFNMDRKTGVISEESNIKTFSTNSN